jgi:fluoride ion exporter CrcB/FEX
VIDDIRKYLAGGLTIGSFLILGAILYLAHDQKEIIYAMMTGILSTLTTLTGFYFGSSQGSQNKTDLIRAMVDKEDCK